MTFVNSASPAASTSSASLALDERLALLDDPQEWSQFSNPEPGQEACWSSSVVFEGMHCTACAITIEEVLRQVPGVRSVQVSAASHRGRVLWSSAVTRPSLWMQASAQAGYMAVPAHDAQAHERRRQEARRMVWRVSVAGLCMMQVMMYATPAYVAEPGDISPDMLHLLRWASWVLSLPVMLFACTPFFSAAWRDVRQRRISMDLPVAIGMLVTFAVSSVGTFEPQGPFGAEVFFDSLTMFVFFLLLGRWMELRMRDRTAGALEAVLNRLPDSVRRRRPDGQWERISIRQMAVGDWVEVLPGEALPGDGTVMQGQTEVDEALLTGESRPLARGAGQAVIAGSHNLSARIEVRIDQVGAATRYAQIVALMESAAVHKPAIAELADRWAKPFLLGVLLAALGALLAWWPQGPARALMVAVAVLVVTCPCALSLATPAAMLASAGAMARSGVLVRRLQALQNLAGIDTVVFDKTGTLTQDSFSVAALRTRAGFSAAQAWAWAQSVAVLSLHPISRAIVVQAREQAQPDRAPAPAPQVLDSHEYPGQGLSVRCQWPDGRVGELRWGSARFCAAPAGPQQRLQVHLADEQGWLATFELHETLRPEAAGVIRALQAQGVAVRILSGDAVAAVAPVAQALGVDDYRGDCSPQDKLQAIVGMQAQGHKVVMVGDGLNDGPVLAGADVSFALGQAVALTQSRADMVLMSARLDMLVPVLLRSRQTLRVVRQNLAWSVGYNAACVPLALMGWLPAWAAGLGMAGSSLWVVLNALRLSGALQPVSANE
ncbi:MAG: cation-translocating P-type ATPase [Betaproteobacteria bacterium]|nr:cation-translocating P-type ATPase [Betaproteobacteria bacterium]